jgi:ABC-type Fe3+-siderophore transport system permease subunit
MQSVIEILKTLANSAVQAGLIAALIGGISAFYMLIRSTKRTKQTKATKLDALYLSYSSPGFSRFSMLNSPDTLGMGVYAALALEQVGAIADIKPHIDVNLRLYPEWPATYLSAARYCALVGEKQKARDYISVANTLTDSQKSTSDIPQLEKSVVEALITSEVQPLPSTTSLETMFEELRKKPHLLVLARSVTALLAGLGLIFGGILLHMIRSLIS